MPENAKTPQASGRGYGLLGSLKDALAAASREDQHPAVMKAEMVVAERASPSVGLVALAPSAPPRFPLRRMAICSPVSSWRVSWRQMRPTKVLTDRAVQRQCPVPRRQRGRYAAA